MPGQLSCKTEVQIPRITADTAGERYLRKNLPGTAGIFTCGAIYLQLSKTILTAPFLECRPVRYLKVYKLNFNCIETVFFETVDGITNSLVPCLRGIYGSSHDEKKIQNKMS